jgi:hypothetical protein
VDSVFLLSAGFIPSGPVLEFHTDREQPSSADVCCPSASPIADSSILSHMPLCQRCLHPKKWSAQIPARHI